MDLLEHQDRLVKMVTGVHKEVKAHEDHKGKQEREGCLGHQEDGEQRETQEQLEARDLEAHLEDLVQLGLRDLKGRKEALGEARRDREVNQDTVTVLQALNKLINAIVRKEVFTLVETILQKSTCLELCIRGGEKAAAQEMEQKLSFLEHLRVRRLQTIYVCLPTMMASVMEARSLLAEKLSLRLILPLPHSTLVTFPAPFAWHLSRAQCSQSQQKPSALWAGLRSTMDLS